MKRSMLTSGILATCLIAVIGFSLPSVVGQDMPFGGSDDVEFAKNAWEELKGYEDWKMQSDYYEGQSPHGDYVKIYYSMITVDNTPYHVVVKDNFRGDDLTVETVANAPDDYFASATVMIQMDDGYDPKNNNWFWVKYGADGSIMTNPKGMALAGRVAKGSGQGCIACHANARDNDYLFSNDR